MIALEPSKLRCVSWRGRAPKPGEYLRCAGPRARVAYFIVDTDLKYDPLVDWHGKITALKLPVAEVPADAVVRYWEWVKRAKKRVKTLGELTQ